MLDIHGWDDREPMPKPGIRSMTQSLPDGRTIVTSVNNEFEDLGLGRIITEIVFAPGKAA
jgi:hypothetical protein